MRHEDAGVYACAAANHRGQETAYYVLKVRGEDGRTDRWMDGVVVGGVDVPQPILTPPSPQSAWSPILGRRPAPSSPCPPSRMLTRGSRSSSPSDLTLLMVSADGTPVSPLVSPPCPLYVPSIVSSSLPSPSLPPSSPLCPLAPILYSTKLPPNFWGGSPPSWGCFGVPQDVIRTPPGWGPSCLTHRHPAGLLLYNGQRKNSGADFISFGLVGGRPEFR